MQCTGRNNDGRSQTDKWNDLDLEDNVAVFEEAQSPRVDRGYASRQDKGVLSRIVFPQKRRPIKTFL